jgi:phage repressor protein C with HTH and peptisase S24 domain
MIEGWEKRFRELMEGRGFTMKSLSLEAGLNESFVRDMLQRKRVPSIDKFARLTKLLGTTVAEFTNEPVAPAFTVPLMGFVGAGAEVEPDFEQVPADGLDQIAVPFPLPAEMIALEVRGDSMLPQYRDGTIIIAYREQRRAVESFYGEEACVRTSDGRRFIKTIMRGEGNTVNLISWNASPIEGARLEWIGEIFSVFPASAMRRAAREANRKGGIQGQLKLRA